MSRLGILPLNVYAPGRPTAPWEDGITTTHWDGVVAMTRTDVVLAGRLEARLAASWDEPSGMLMGVTVTLPHPDPSPLTIARVNRLLTDLQAPRLETYFRTGALVWRMSGTPAPVATFPGIAGDASVTGWTWRALPGVTLAPVDAAPEPAPAPAPPPAAPVVTPTTTPAAPVTAPALEPEPAPVAPVDEPAPAPAPEPEPVPEPEPAPAPLRLRPARADRDRRGLFTYPTRSATNIIVTTEGNRRRLAAAWAQHVAGEPATVALVGPAGVGKTSMLDDMAAEHGIGIFTFDAMGAASFSDWTGRVDLDPTAQGITTRYVFSSFIVATRCDEACADTGHERRIVRVDEMNRAESGGALNALMPILSAGSLYIPETGETVRICPGVLFAFTLNRGSAYAGTVTLDEALADRAQYWVRLDYLPEDEEATLVVDRVGLTLEQALPLVKAARQVREVANRGEIGAGISTRRVLIAARAVKYGLSLADAAEACWADKYPDEGGDAGERGRVMFAVKASLPA